MNKSLNVVPARTNNKRPIVSRRITLPHARCSMILSARCQRSFIKSINLCFIYTASARCLPSPPPMHASNEPTFRLKRNMYPQGFITLYSLLVSIQTADPEEPGVLLVTECE